MNNNEEKKQIEEKQLDDVQGGCLLYPTYPVPQEFTNGVVLNYKEALEK